MKTSLSKEELLNYVIKQMEVYIPDGYIVDCQCLRKALDRALERCEVCFRHITFPGYCEGGEAVFSHVHIDQYVTFLYFLANSLWTMEGEKEKRTCDKLINLFRILSGCVISYKCNLPDIFLIFHPVGSVIGNATFSDGLVILQNVTVSTPFIPNGTFIGRGCFLGCGATVMGNCRIGERVSLGVHSLVYNNSVPNDSIVRLTEEGKCIVTQRIKQRCAAQQYFDIVL